MTVSTTATKVTSSHHILSLGTLVLSTKTTRRGDNVATALGQKSFSVAYLVKV